MEGEVFVMDTVVWKDLVDRVVSFKFKDRRQDPIKKDKRHEGVVVIYPRGFGIMSRNSWIVYTYYRDEYDNYAQCAQWSVEEMSLIVLPLDEEIIWKIENNFYHNSPDFTFRPLQIS